MPKRKTDSNSDIQPEENQPPTKRVQSKIDHRARMLIIAYICREVFKDENIAYITFTNITKLKNVKIPDSHGKEFSVWRLLMATTNEKRAEGQTDYAGIMELPLSQMAVGVHNRMCGTITRSTIKANENQLDEVEKTAQENTDIKQINTYIEKLKHEAKNNTEALLASSDYSRFSHSLVLTVFLHDYLKEKSEEDATVGIWPFSSESGEEDEKSDFSAAIGFSAKSAFTAAKSKGLIRYPKVRHGKIQAGQLRIGLTNIDLSKANKETDISKLRETPRYKKLQENFPNYDRPKGGIDSYKLLIMALSLTLCDQDPLSEINLTKYTVWLPQTIQYQFNNGGSTCEQNLNMKNFCMLRTNKFLTLAPKETTLTKEDLTDSFFTEVEKIKKIITITNSGEIREYFRKPPAQKTKINIQNITLFYLMLDTVFEEISEIQFDKHNKELTLLIKYSYKNNETDEIEEQELSVVIKQVYDALLKVNSGEKSVINKNNAALRNRIANAKQYASHIELTITNESDIIDFFKRLQQTGEYEDEDEDEYDAEEEKNSEPGNNRIRIIGFSQATPAYQAMGPSSTSIILAGLGAFPRNETVVPESQKEEEDIEKDNRADNIGVNEERNIVNSPNGNGDGLPHLMGRVVEEQETNLTNPLNTVEESQHSDYGQDITYHMRDDDDDVMTTMTMTNS